VVGALASLGYERPKNLVHVLLDNEVHDSTGGQFTTSHSVDLAAVAAACGYPKVLRCHTPEEVRDAIRDATTDFIPGRGWIRRLSGAEQHSRHVQSAIQAGRMRRAFLKGTGMQRNCAPPAAPGWFRPRGHSQR
jgi:hypothetical protein